MTNQYQIDYEEYINKQTKNNDEDKPSFRKHLEDNGFIKNKESVIDSSEPFSNFNDFLDRKKEMNKDNG